MANDGIKFLNNIQRTVTSSKIVTICSIAGSIIIALGSVGMSFYFLNTERNRIYLLDNGSVLTASRADNDAQRDLEIQNHVTRFHELFFNVAPNTETINRNLNLAMQLSDKSVYNYLNDLKEQQFYLRLVNTGSSQQVYIDSMKINMDVYPYQVETYLLRYYTRATSVTKYQMKTTCVLEDVPRSESNPNGLLIERFALISDKEIGTRKR